MLGRQFNALLSDHPHAKELIGLLASMPSIMLMRVFRRSVTVPVCIAFIMSWRIPFMVDVRDLTASSYCFQAVACGSEIPSSVFR